MSDEQNPDRNTPETDDAPFAAEFAALEALKNEVETLKDLRLRALAEVENVRRRAERDKHDANQYAITRFARDMLGIADNFSRALAACPAELRENADPQIKAVLEGVEATDRQLMTTLEQYGVHQIDTSDGRFDPNLHQAIAEVPGGDKPAGTIVTVVQTGFTIGERLLRPAMVTVAARAPQNAAGSGVDAKA